eukprot:Ihof_evm1s175 gene=Ihof_evmTU1s175
MVQKKTQIQPRVKGNARSSSSQAASEFVAKSGLGVIGFQALQQNPALLVTGKQDGESDEAGGLPNEFRVTFKKLLKKDATTKIKALQELSALVEASDLDVILVALPYWSPAYNKLVTDIDRRVRTESNHTLLQFIKKAKKNFAPQFKRVAASLVCSQFDTYKDVAASAVAVFDFAFPGPKKDDAIKYCRSEISSYAIDIITTARPETLSDAKMVEEVDMEAKYYRMVTASLRAVILLEEAIPTTQCLPYLTVLFSDKKFWRHAQSQNSDVRWAMYDVVATTCKMVPDVILTHIALVAPNVFSFLEEKERGLHASMWAGVLSLVKDFPTAWAHANFRKAVFPKIRAVLKGAGFGSPNVAMASILPLVASIPVDVIEDKSAFALEVLTYIWEGLYACGSHSTREILLQTYIECLQYFTVKAAKEGDTVTCQTLLLDKALPLTLECIQTLTMTWNSELHILSYKGMTTLLWSLWAIGGVDDVITLFWTNLRDVAVCRSASMNAEVDPWISVQVSRFVETLYSVGKDQASVPDAYWINITYLAAQVANTALNDASSLSILHIELLTNIINALSTPNQADLFYNKLSEVAGHSVSRVSLLTDHVLPNLRKGELNLRDLETNGGFEVASALVLLACSLLYDHGPGGLTLDPVHWQLVWTELGHLPSKIDYVELMFVALNRVWRTKDATLLARLDIIDETLCQLATDLCKYDKDEFDVERILMFALSGPTEEGCVCEGQPLVSLSAVELIINLITATLSDMIDNPEAKNLRKITTLLVLVSKYDISFAADRLPADFITSFITMLSVVLALVTSILSSPLATEARDIAGKAMWDFENGAKELGKQYPEASRQLCEACLARPRAALQSLFTSPLCVEALVSQVGVVVESVCEQEVDRQLAIDFASPSIDLWQTVQSQVPRIDATPITMNGSLLMPSHESNIQVGRAVLSLEEAEPVLKIALFTTSLIAHLGWDQFFLSTDPDQLGETEALPAQTHARASTIVWLLWAHTWVYNFIHVHNLHHANQSDLKSTSALFQVINEVDSVMAALIQDLIASKHTAVFVRALIASAVSFCKAGDSTSMQVFYMLLDKLHKGKVLGPKSEETLLLSLAEALVKPETFCASNISSVQVLLAALDVFVPDLLSTSTCLASIASSQMEILFNQTPAALHSPTYSPALVSSLAIFTSCIAQGNLTRRKQVEKVVSHVSALFTPTAQAARMRALATAVSPSQQETVATTNASLQVARLLSTYVSIEAKQGGLDAIKIDLVGKSCSEWLEVNRIGSNRGQLAITSITFRLLAALQPMVNAPAPVCAVRTVKDVTEMEESSEDSEGEDIDMDTMVQAKRLHGVWDSHAARIAVLLMDCLLSIPDTESQCPSWERRVALHSLKSYVDAVSVGSLPSTAQGAEEEDKELCSLLNMLGIEHAATQTLLYQLLLPRLLVDLEKLSVSGGDVDSDDVSQVDQISELESDGRLCKPHEGLVQAILSLPDDMHIARGVVQPSVVHTLKGRHWVYGYMLGWLLVFHCIRHAKPEIRADYAVYLKKINGIDRLLATVFNLLPDSMHVTPAHSKGIQHLSLNRVDVHSGEDLALLAGHVYYQALMAIPALCRGWFTDAPRKIKERVEKYTVDHVSPLIVEHEVDTVVKAAALGENLKVKGSHVSREVTASYQLDEVSLEIIITMPVNHPLGMVNVDSGTHFDLKSYRKWLLQMTTFLASQNGSIMEAIQLWQRNIDKKYEGVEECPICYS